MAQLRIAEKDYVIEQLSKIFKQKLDAYRTKLTATQSVFKEKYYNSSWEYIESKTSRHKTAFTAGRYSVILKDEKMEVILDQEIIDKKLLKSLELKYNQYKEKLKKQKQECLDQLMVGSSDTALKMLQDFRKL